MRDITQVVTARIPTSQDVYAVERKMLEAIEHEWERWTGQDPMPPMPPLLAKMLVDVHTRIVSRLQRSAGAGSTFDPNDTAALRALLVQLEQEKAEVQQMLQQKEMMLS